MDKELEEILDEFCGSNKMYRDIVDEVVEYSQNYDGDDKEKLIGVLEDIGRSGLASGIIGSLIYYDDTERFFNTYYDEIFDVLSDIEDNGLDPMEWLKSLVRDDIAIIMCTGISKNYISWMTYEYVCDELLNVLENE